MALGVRGSFSPGHLKPSSFFGLLRAEAPQEGGLAITLASMWMEVWCWMCPVGVQVCSPRPSWSPLPLFLWWPELGHLVPRWGWASSLRNSPEGLADPM